MLWPVSPATRGWIALGWACAGVLGLVIVAMVSTPSYAVAGDAHYLLATARSLAFDGDLDLTNQYWVMGDRWGLGRDPATDGWRLPPREIGAAVLMVPGLWVHHAIGVSSHWEPTFACALTAASLGGTWLGCLACLDALDTRAGRERSNSRGWLASGMVLASVVPYYVVGRAGYNHGADALVCSWVAWAWISRPNAALSGLLIAGACLVRLQNLVWLVWPVMEAASRGAERRPNAVRGLQIGLLALLGVLPQVWLALAHPGSDGGAIRWDLGFFDLRDLPGDLVRVVLGVHGLVSWTPLAGVGIVGLLLAPPAERPLARRALAVLGLMILVCASVRDVDGGDAFGARRLAGMLPLLAVGLAILFDRLSARGRQALSLASALAVGLNLTVVVLALTGAISLASPVTADSTLQR